MAPTERLLPLLPLLCLETSGNALQIGLYNSTASGDVERVYSLDVPVNSQRTHSALLVPKLQEAFAQTGLSLQEITSLALTLGPGSFTGLRSGLCSARAFLQACPHLQAYGFHSLELLASSILAQRPELLSASPTIALLLDARRGQVYAGQATVKNETDALFNWPLAPCVLSLEVALAHISEGLLLCDAGAVKQLEVLSWQPPARVTLLPIEQAISWNAPEAMLALLANETREPTPLPDLLPLYLQLPNITIKVKP